MLLLVGGNLVHIVYMIDQTLPHSGKVHTILSTPLWLLSYTDACIWYLSRSSPWWWLFIIIPLAAIARLGCYYMCALIGTSYRYACSMAVSAVWLIQYWTRGAQSWGWALYKLYGMQLPCYRAIARDVTVTWKPYGRPFWCTVGWRLSMLHDALAKCSPNLTADGLTSQVCSISLPGTCYMWDVSALAA